MNIFGVLEIMDFFFWGGGWGGGGGGGGGEGSSKNRTILGRRLSAF